MMSHRKAGQVLETETMLIAAPVRTFWPSYLAGRRKWIVLSAVYFAGVVLGAFLAARV